MTIRPAFLFSIILMLLAACSKGKPYTVAGEESFPPVAVEYAALYRMDALPVSPGFFRQHWTWVGFGPADCEDACRLRLDLLNSVSGGQGLFVVNELTDHVRLRSLADRFPQVAIAMGTTAVSFDLFEKQFAQSIAAVDNDADRLYLVSPAAQIVYSIDSKDLSSDGLEQEFSHARSLAE